MLRAVAMTLVLAAPAAAEETVGRTQISSDGARGIRFVHVGKGQCRIEAVSGTEVTWKLEECVGSIDDLYFISNDGERFWVLTPLPQKPKGKKVRWDSAVVARLFDKEGTLLQVKSLRDLVPPKGREAVRQLKKHFKWLEGVVDVPGKGPRVAEGDQVEFETVDRRTVRLRFASQE
ncbi:MAG: hypothetical protein ACOZIN_05680 [Myxococcota bacterium]